MKINVLNKGYVEYRAHMYSDVDVANVARVSFNKHTDILREQDKKLINYLAEHNHWTPFAHPQISLRVKAPIAIRTQLFKHKVGLVENEVSRRYVTEDPEVYIPDFYRSKPEGSIKQGSGDIMNEEDQEYCDWNYVPTMIEAIRAYDNLIKIGMAPEQARFVLPQGVYTEWFWTGSLHAFARVCKLRLDPHAQWEVQQYAAAISEILQGLYPVSFEALMK